MPPYPIGCSHTSQVAGWGSICLSKPYIKLSLRWHIIYVCDWFTKYFNRWQHCIIWSYSWALITCYIIIDIQFSGNSLQYHSIYGLFLFMCKKRNKFVKIKLSMLQFSCNITRTLMLTLERKLHDTCTYNS